jgi:ABC-2 type transport system ATP-binding protein
MTDPIAIHIEGLTKCYGDVTAVRDLSLRIEPGEVFAYIGPNGAGKTTTIKVLTGLLRPTQGKVAILGHDIQSDPVNAKRLTGYIPDHPYLYEKLTGRDFVHFVSDLFGLDRETAESRMAEYFELFELTGVEDELI